MARNVSFLEYVVAVCGQGSRVRDLLSTFRLFRNWYDVVLFRFGLKPKLTMELRTGESVRITSLEDYNNFYGSKLYLEYMSRKHNSKLLFTVKKNNIRFLWHGKKIMFYCDSAQQRANSAGMIIETFIDEQYSRLNVKDRDVVDIGANVGDTAMYFALKGAKHVYAFEPYPYSYNIAKRNIKQSDLAEKITLLNEGCGKKATVNIPEEFKNYGGSDLRGSNNGVKIKVSPLKEIIKRYKLKNAVLKIDCEGCEYPVILDAANGDLGAFNQIILEYHYGYKNIEEKLIGAGFKVEHSIPYIVHNSLSRDSSMILGMIYSVKR